jgi:hypothetical protein
MLKMFLKRTFSSEVPIRTFLGFTKKMQEKHHTRKFLKLNNLGLQFERILQILSQK